MGTLCSGGREALGSWGLHILTMDIFRPRSGRQAWPRVSTVKSRGLSLVLTDLGCATARPAWLCCLMCRPALPKPWWGEGVRLDPCGAGPVLGRPCLA